MRAPARSLKKSEQTRARRRSAAPGATPLKIRPEATKTWPAGSRKEPPALLAVGRVVRILWRVWPVSRIAGLRSLLPVPAKESPQPPVPVLPGERGSGHGGDNCLNRQAHRTWIEISVRRPGRDDDGHERNETDCAPHVRRSLWLAPIGYGAGTHNLAVSLTETTRPTEGYSVFATHSNTCVVLHMTHSRRLHGWPSVGRRRNGPAALSRWTSRRRSGAGESLLNPEIQNDGSGAIQSVTSMQVDHHHGADPAEGAHRRRWCDRPLTTP